MMSAIPKTVSGLVLAALLAGLSACSADPLKVPLTFVKNIQMPRDTGAPAFDLLTLDPAAGRLYVAHGSANTLEIVDVKSASIIGSVPNLPGIKATALSSDPNVIFTANGTDGSVSVVDVKLLKVLANIKVGNGADAIDYDPVHGLVIVSINSDSLGFIDEKDSQGDGRVETAREAGVDGG